MRNKSILLLLIFMSISCKRNGNTSTVKVREILSSNIEDLIELRSFSENNYRKLMGFAAEAEIDSIFVGFNGDFKFINSKIVELKRIPRKTIEYSAIEYAGFPKMEIENSEIEFSYPDYKTKYFTMDSTFTNIHTKIKKMHEQVIRYGKRKNQRFLDFYIKEYQKEFLNPKILNDAAELKAIKQEFDKHSSLTYAEYQVYLDGIRIYCLRMEVKIYRLLLKIIPCYCGISNRYTVQLIPLTEKLIEGLSYKAKIVMPEVDHFRNYSFYLNEKEYPINKAEGTITLPCFSSGLQNLKLELFDNTTGYQFKNEQVLKISPK